jgi:hypothetical protein
MSSKLFKILFYSKRKVASPDSIHATSKRYIEGNKYQTLAMRNQARLCLLMVEIAPPFSSTLFELLWKLF